MSAWEKVVQSRDLKRLKPLDYVNALFEDQLPLHGDRYFADDQSIQCGIASFEGIPISYIAFAKGHSAEENIAGNFGMATPEAYRKCVRIIEQAEKFARPVLTFVDTPGAYPGVEAEQRGQGEAIAQLIWKMQSAKTPTIAIITGEGGSGGALCLSMADRILMLENAVFSILSPEGFSAILWKNKSRAKEAAEVMKITAEDLQSFGIVDQIISESSNNQEEILFETKKDCLQHLQEIMPVDPGQLVEKRIQKFRNLGV